MKSSKYITASLLVWFFMVAGCGQDYNSNSADEDLGGGKVQAPTDENCATPEQARSCKALKVIQTRCVSCHPSWKEYKTDEQWVTAGYVTVGNHSASKLIKRIINSGGDMPLGGPALPSDEYDGLTAWVDGL
jgi:mono/diheme cytochrome c family protein